MYIYTYTCIYRGRRRRRFALIVRGPRMRHCAHHVTTPLLAQRVPPARYIRMYVYIYVYIHVCIRVCVYIYSCVCIYILCICI